MVFSLQGRPSSALAIARVLCCCLSSSAYVGVDAQSVTAFCFEPLSSTPPSSCQQLSLCTLCASLVLLHGPQMPNPNAFFRKYGVTIPGQ